MASTQPRIEILLEEVIKKKGSDLHLQVGLAPMLRVDGSLVAVSGDASPDRVQGVRPQSVRAAAAVDDYETPGRDRQWPLTRARVTRRRRAERGIESDGSRRPEREVRLSTSCP